MEQKKNNGNNITESDKYNIEILPSEISKSDLSCKIIILGDSGVGKSSLSYKVVKNEFKEQITTLGIEILSYNVKINNKIIKLQIHDTCGQEVYRALISGYYRNVTLAILMYAINNKESFNQIKKWLDDLKKLAPPDIIIILVGNKADLEEERNVTREEGEKFKKDNKLDLFMETSAKTGNNANNVLIEAAKLLYENYNIMEEQMKEKEKNKNISIDNEEQKEENKEKKKCCSKS